jgi:hypothetical protein
MNYPFLDFLLWFQSAKRSGRFYLQTSDNAADLYLLDGCIIHAQAGLEIGLEPFLQLLHDWEEPKVVAWEVNRMPEYQTLWLDAASTVVLLTRYAHSEQNGLNGHSGTQYRDRPLYEETQQDGVHEFTFHVESETAGTFSKDFNVDHIQVGRDEHNELAINDPSLSRQHAFITRKGKKLFIHDLNSSNGTTVDGNPIIFAQITEGQIIRFGNAVCTFNSREASAENPLTAENVMKTSLIPKNLLNKARSRSQLLRPDPATLSLNAEPSPEMNIAVENPQPPARPRKTRPLGMAPQIT